MIVHELCVRTQTDVIYRVGCQHVTNRDLAVRLALALRAFLAQADVEYTAAARWAFAARDVLEDEGARLANCRVEVVRLQVRRPAPARPARRLLAKPRGRSVIASFEVGPAKVMC